MKIDRTSILTGIPLLDTQHGEYFDLVERMFNMYEQRDTDASHIREILQEIQKYGQEHFDTEEQFMETENYPELDAHRAKHDEFKNSIDAYLEELDNSSDLLDFTQRIRHLLVVWFERQIKDDDMRLAAFLKKRGYGGG